MLEVILINFLPTVDIIGQDAPECAASDMSVYGGLQMGGDGAGTASEANFSAITSLSRTDPDLEGKRKAYVSFMNRWRCFHRETTRHVSH